MAKSALWWGIVEEIVFQGPNALTLDSKGRIAVPTRHRDLLTAAGVNELTITLHPDGIPHGPHPGRYEASIGQKWTNELAVMMDSFRPLKVAKAARKFEEPGYHKSWVEAQHAMGEPPIETVTD